MAEISPERAVLTGDAADHVVRSLRMRPGETLVVCDMKGADYHCAVAEISDGSVFLTVLEVRPTVSEPDVAVTLFQCLPKGDKMESVIQKSVELGVHRIVPVLSARCVSRPDDRSTAKKLLRWQKIADEAAGQSGRGILPQVAAPVPFAECAASLGEFDRPMLFYEAGGRPLAGLIAGGIRTAALLVGPEGGFDPAEVELARKAGAEITTLGPRILRTETAPLAALASVMLLTGNLA